LVEERLGGAKGQLWWFKDPNPSGAIEGNPVNGTSGTNSSATLQGKGRVTFTEAWEAVSIQFPNSLTSDSTSIKEALETICKTCDWWVLVAQATSA